MRIQKETWKNRKEKRRQTERKEEKKRKAFRASIAVYWCSHGYSLNQGFHGKIVRLVFLTHKVIFFTIASEKKANKAMRLLSR